MICGNCINLFSYVPLRRHLTEKSCSKGAVRAVGDLREDPCTRRFTTEIPPCQEFFRDKGIANGCSPDLSTVFDSHRSITGSYNAFYAQIPCKEYEQVIPADVSPLVIECHHAVGIAVVDNCTPGSCFFHNLPNI